MLASGRSVWRFLVAFSILFVPSYFKFVLGSNSLSGASVLFTLGYLSVRRRLSIGSKDPLSISFGPKEDGYQVQVLSYNIFMRPPFIKNNEDDFKNERLDEFINHIDRFDIICLQEIFNLANTRQQTLILKAREKGFLYLSKSVNPGWASGKFIDAGLLIMSKYPILETDGLIYRAGFQIDGWAAKQVIYAKIQISPTFFLHVTTTHLQASYFDNHESKNVLNDQARADQIKEMAEFVAQKTHGSPYPVLITGDFNVDSRVPGSPYEETSEYKYMMETFLAKRRMTTDLLKEFNNGTHPITYGDVCEIEVDGASKTAPRETILTHKADHCCALSIDYVLFGDTEENRREKIVEVENAQVERFFVDGDKHKVTQLSDHYGISTVLKVNRSDGCVELNPSSTSYGYHQGRVADV